MIFQKTAVQLNKYGYVSLKADDQETQDLIQSELSIGDVVDMPIDRGGLEPDWFKDKIAGKKFVVIGFKELRTDLDYLQKEQ